MAQKKKITAQKKDDGRALPFDRTDSYTSYGGADKKATVVNQRGFDVAVRVPGYVNKKGETRYFFGQKPGFVTQRGSNYEDPVLRRESPVLQRGRGSVTLKRGGVVGPKNVKESSQGLDYSIATLVRDRNIKKQQTKKTNMVKAGRNTSGRRVGM